MQTKKATRANLVDVVSAELERGSGKPRRRAAAYMVEVTLDALARCIACSDRVELRGVGVFTKHVSGPRRYHDPNTGRLGAEKPARTRIHFRPGTGTRRLIEKAAHELA